MLKELGWPLIQIAGASMPHASLACNVKLRFLWDRFPALLKHACAAAMLTRGTPNAIASCTMQHTRWVAICVPMHGTAQRRSTTAQHCNKEPERCQCAAALASQFHQCAISRMLGARWLSMVLCPLNTLDSSAARCNENGVPPLMLSLPGRAELRHAWSAQHCRPCNDACRATLTPFGSPAAE
jgi:hypothetical protein